jgi:hypothetical protein
MLSKKLLCIVLILIFVIADIFPQNYSAKTWEILYKKSISIKEKREKVKQMSDVATPEFENLILYILKEEVDMPYITNSQDRKIYEEWVNYTIMMAGNLKLKNTNTILKTLYQKIDTLKLKGDIAYNIGKIENKEDIPYLVIELNNNNSAQKAGKLAGREELVVRLIEALTFYKDPLCFNALFDSYILSYSEKTKNLSLNALKGISDSPSQLCDQVMKNAKDFNTINEALKYSFKSNSPVPDRINSAKLALTLAMDIRTNPGVETLDSQKRIREEAAFELGELKSSDSESIKLLLKKWGLDKEPQSYLITIETFKKIGTQEAVQVLIDKLAAFTQKAKEGGGTGFATEEGAKITIALIRALGDIGNQIATDELLNVVYTLEYGKPIIDEANKALDKINGKK